MVDATVYAPTDEQQRAMDLFAGGANDLVIEAGAGTGKTTTLAMVARTTPRTGSYLAFNKAIARDAGAAMPPQVASSTVHSVAARWIRRQPQYAAVMDRLGGARIAPYRVAKHLRIGPIYIDIPTPTGMRTKVLQPAWQASHIMRAVTAFCQTGDPRPTRDHFPYVDGIDPRAADGRRTWANNRAVAAELEPALHRAWEDVTRPDGDLRVTHDVYLKLAQLNGATIPGDYLMLDEAQDANGVMLAWLATQGRPIVYVGDTQQQIYAWRGAVNALGLVGDDTPRAYLTQSWRFGPAIADVANGVLERLEANLRLRGTDTIPSVVHRTNSGPPPRAVLCRTNAAAVAAVLRFQEKGYAPHLVGGADDIVWFAQAAGQLQAGERTRHPELACFETWREVQSYVDDDPGGDDLRMLVKLIDEYGPQIVVDALDGLIAEAGADVIISTAHRAKGREWEAVRLASDFDPGSDDDVMADDELRLLYVAATRATHSLDISGCVLADMVPA